MVFASLRFNDATHVKPKELIIGRARPVRRGLADESRAETPWHKFIVPKVGFKTGEWLEAGWDLFQAEVQDRAFCIRELNARTKFRDSPASYHRSLQWIRFFSKYAINQHFQGTELRMKELISSLAQITAHSARVTY